MLLEWSAVDSSVTPVMLPPGRATPSTRPVATGSPAALMTIGMCDDDIHMGGLELGYEAVESLGVRVGRSLHGNEVLAVDEAVRGQNGEKGLLTLVGRTHRGAGDEQPYAIDFPRLLARAPSGHAAAVPPNAAINSRRPIMTGMRTLLARVA